MASVACATTSPVESSAPATSSTAADVPGAPVGAATPTPSTTAPSTTTPAAATPAATVPPKVGPPERTADGIDDENWLPRKDTAGHRAFVEATEALRSDPRGAPQRFAAAATVTPGFYAAWFNAGAASEAIGDVAAAEGHYRQALRIRPDHGPSLINLATLLATAGRDADAKRLIDDALKAAPNKAGPHGAAAVRALRTRDLVSAEQQARDALKLDERNVPAMLVLAQVFRGQGRLDTARFAVDNGLALEPGNALLHLERGHVLLAQGERLEALFAFERAARLRPSLPEALEPYGRLLLERGFAVEARTALEMLVRQQPKNAVAHLHLGNALRATKAYPGAEAAYKKALDLDPYLDDVHFNLALLHIDNAVGDADELVRLQKGLDALKLYQSRARPDAATKARLTEYIETTERRIGREQKRRERDRKRKADEAAKPAAGATPTPPATGSAPPTPTPPAPTTGAADDK